MAKKHTFMVLLIWQWRDGLCKVLSRAPFGLRARFRSPIGENYTLHARRGKSDTRIGRWDVKITIFKEKICRNNKWNSQGYLQKLTKSIVQKVAIFWPDCLSDEDITTCPLPMPNLSAQSFLFLLLHCEEEDKTRTEEQCTFLSLPIDNTEKRLRTLLFPSRFLRRNMCNFVPSAFLFVRGDEWASCLAACYCFAFPVKNLGENMSRNWLLRCTKAVRYIFWRIDRSSFEFKRRMSFLLHGPFQTIDADAVFPQKCAKKKREVRYISPQIRLSSFLFSFPPLFAAAQNSIAFACGPPLGSNATRIELAWKKTFLRKKRRRGEARFMSRGKGKISLLEESGFFPFSLFNYFCG